MDLLWFILDYQLGEPTIRSVCSPRTVSAWSAFLMPFPPFVYGYPSSSPRAHCTPNKSVPTLRYTRRRGPIYTGPCPKALMECSPLDFRRSSITCMLVKSYCRQFGSLLLCSCDIFQALMYTIVDSTYMLLAPYVSDYWLSFLETITVSWC